MTFTITQNDTSPALESQLLDNNVPVDISGFNEVSFHMENKFDEVVIDDDTTGSVIVADPSLGEVEYQFDQTQTATIGTYSAHWEVEYGDGSIETFPSSGSITVEVTEEIA